METRSLRHRMPDQPPATPPQDWGRGGDALTNSARHPLTWIPEAGGQGGGRKPLGRRLWARLLRWRYLLLQRHRHDRLVLEQVAGYAILVLPQVFNPILLRTGALLAQALGPELIAPGSRVLDMGTGSGIGAIAAARWAGQVVAVDINPAAVRCARINALLNQCEECVEVRQGDLFEPLGDAQFDTVLFNPPYYPGTPSDALDRAFHSVDVATRFAQGLPRHLASGGQLLLLLSTDGDQPAFLRPLEAQGLDVQPYARYDLRSELVTIYRVRAQGNDIYQHPSPTAWEPRVPDTEAQSFNNISQP